MKPWKQHFLLKAAIAFLLLATAGDPAHAYRNGQTGPNLTLDTLTARIDEAKVLLSNEMYRSAVKILDEALSYYDYIIDKVDSNKSILSQIYYQLGFAYFYLGEYDKSFSHFYNILKIKEITPFTRAKAYIGISNVANARHHYDEAEQALNEVLKINENLKDNIIFISAYNNLSNIFMAKDSYDSALFYLDKAYEKSISASDSSRRIALMMNMANILQLQSRWEEAEYYYFKAIKEAKKQQNQYCLCESQYGLAVLWLKLQRNEEGLELLHTCLENTFPIGYKRIQLLIYGRLSRYFEEKRDYRQAYNYLSLYQDVNDSIFNLESERNINQLKADFDLYRIETSKQLLEQDVALYKNAIFRRNLNLCILSILIIIALFFVWYIAKKLRNRNRDYFSLRSDFDSFQANVHTEKQKILERFESELEAKHKELTTNALLLVKSEEIAGEILEYCKHLKIGAKGEQAKTIASIESAAKELYMGRGWEEFKYSFEQVNSKFYTQLDSRYPGLTASDRRFAALLCLGLTTKEIALMTNRSVRGVETSKFRLKKKMGLESDQNLSEILMSLK